MLKLYFKQAIELMRQNKLFTGIYIFGTALAIASTTILAVVIYLDIAPIYPDTNRANVYYMNNSAFKEKNEKSQYISGYSYKAVNEWFYTLKNAKVVSAELGSGRNVSVKHNYKNYEFRGVFTDVNFFDVYNYRFITGAPFTKADFDGEIKKVVISDNVARELYGTVSNSVGKTVKIGYEDYTVCGVIEKPSVIAGESFAEVIAPYTTHESYRFELNGLAYVGSYYLRFVVEDDNQAEALRAEIVDIFHRFSNSNPDWNVNFQYLHLNSATRNSRKLDGWDEFHKSAGGMLLLIGVFILLLIPALNLSGMISSRMEMRKLEMGVRKSFGATRGSLLKQVMWENLILTIIGGLVGVILCWVIIYGCKDYLMIAFIGENASVAGVDIDITAEMIFAPAVYIFSLGACVVLNVMSAYIPAKRALSRPVVEMLNDKK